MHIFLKDQAEDPTIRFSIEVGCEEVELVLDGGDLYVNQETGYPHKEEGTVLEQRDLTILAACCMSVLIDDEERLKGLDLEPRKLWLRFKEELIKKLVPQEKKQDVDSEAIAHIKRRLQGLAAQMGTSKFRESVMKIHDTI